MGNNSHTSPYFKGDTPEVPPDPLHDVERGFVVPRIGPTRLANYPWHDEVKPLLFQRYQVLGWSKTTWENDWALLRRTCHERHPAQISTLDMEQMLLRIATQNGRVAAVNRYKSIWRNLRYLGVVPESCKPEEFLPKLRKPRSVPRPISLEQAQLLMTQAREPMRDWFTLACLAGMRAMEVANIRGSWLEQTHDGYSLRILGKGGTDLTIPAHPLVVRTIQKHRTLGRLWDITPGSVSDAACEEMRRHGIYAPLTFHSCRHFFATYLLEESGGDLILVSELMRHESLQTTRGYAQLKQGRKRDVLNRLFLETRGNSGDRLASA